MFLATTTAANGGVMSTGMLIMWLVIMFGMMYFLMIRPQKKEQKKLQAMLNDLAVGDAVVTTSGFYGVVIDITDDDVIVEFGNNKNCRIPMRKTAITEVEKPETAVVEEKTEKKKEFHTAKSQEKRRYSKKRMPAFFLPRNFFGGTRRKRGKMPRIFLLNGKKAKRLLRIVRYKEISC